MLSSNWPFGETTLYFRGAIMTIPVRCVACGTVAEAKDKYEGKTGKCPVCGMKIKVPRLNAEIMLNDESRTGETKGNAETVDFEPLGDAAVGDIGETGNS